MRTGLSKILDWLGSQSANGIVLVFSILNKTIFVLLTSTIGKDKMLQLAVTENIISGHGMGVFKYYSTDIYTSVFDKVIEFPPGYSLIMVPFVQLFNHDLYAAAASYDLLISLSLLFVLRWICRLLGFSLFVTNLFTIIYGCFQYIFFLVPAPSDASSLLLIFCGIGVLINIMKRNKKLTNFQLVSSALLFFLPTLFRYQYLPISLLLPVILIWLGYRKRNIYLIRQRYFLLLLTSLLLISMFWILKTYFGEMPQHPVERGFFPSNITKWYPFVPASFINLDFASVQAERITKIGYQNMLVCFEILNVFLAVLLTIQIAQIIKNESQINSSFKLFILSGTAVSVAIILFLLYLSLTHSNNVRTFRLWTFLNDERYFGFIYIFLQIALLGWLYFTKKKIGLFKKIITSLLILMITIECCHGFYYNVKAIFNYEEVKLFQNHDEDYRAFDAICVKIKKENPDAELLVASQDWFFCRKAVLSNIKGIYDAVSLNTELIRVKRKSILLVIIPEDRLFQMENYINERNPLLIATILGTRFYLHEINPL